MINERTLVAVIVAAALAGIGISIYLTVVHLTTSVALVCSNTGVINCERVVTSPYGSIAGSSVPTSAAGILWFGVSIALALLGWLRLHLAWGAAGLLTVLYLVFVEIDRLGAICAWCTAVHVLVLVTFLSVLVLWTSEAGPAPARR